ncbi:MAG TPA: adenylate/guanylate cyclase domain-containing protein [Nitrososphaeraceae archaeon]|jgi:class 3 adenylate cyclase
MASESLRKLSGGPDPYSPDELSKHIDPILLKNLAKIQIDGVEKQQLTIVFWDIAGFSQLSKDLEGFEDDVLYFLKLYCEKAVEIVAKYNGIIDKFIGDGLLAYFGYNSKVGNGDPNDAVSAALEFKEEFLKLKQSFIGYCRKRNGRDPSKIDLKCGLDNGRPALHYFNSLTRNSVIILGSTVNRASRLEGYAEGGQILVSESLKNMIQDEFDYTAIDTKGEIKTFENERYVYTIMNKKR